MYQLITLSSDAAYNHRHQFGSWACWLESTDGAVAIKKSGLLKVDPGGSVQAELMAISNALALLQAQVDLKTVKLTIKTDSQTSIDMLQSIKRRKVKQDFLPMLQYIKSALSDCKSWGMVHIPSHQYIEGDRDYGARHYEMNHWCDRQAARQQYLRFKELEDETGIKRHRRQIKRTSKASKQRQKTITRRMVRSGAKAYKRTKGDFPE